MVRVLLPQTGQYSHAVVFISSPHNVCPLRFINLTGISSILLAFQYYKSIFSKFLIACCIEVAVNNVNTITPAMNTLICSPICVKPKAFKAESVGIWKSVSPMPTTKKATIIKVTKGLANL